MKAQITNFVLARSNSEPSQDVCAGELWRNSLVAVAADGVGGAECGREAATRAVESILNNFKSRPDAWTLRKALDEFTRLINRTLHQESLARFERVEILTTLVALAIEGDRLVGLNVGDSRAYLLHHGRISQLTLDHTETEAGRRHVLTSAVGMDADVEPHAFESLVHPGDSILLCSDGVSNHLDATELRSLLERGASARVIVNAARERATEETLDDMCAVVVHVTEIDAGKGAGPTLDIPESLAVGQAVDGYTLVRPFNQAERTWIATRAGARFVMKFAPREARHNESLRHQFTKEIWTLTRLKAGFFLRAFVPDGGTVLCYCMDYMAAPTLKERLRAGALTVDETVALGKFLLDACQFLLRFDLVHGDIKPENILVLDRADRLEFKLIDFGSITEIFAVATRAGTPSYIAPERFQSAPLMERTEVFSVGVTLHEALTRAFPYGEIEPFQTPSFRAPKRPSLGNPNIPPWLESVLLRATAARPEERYQNFSEMKFDLENPAGVKPWFRKDAPLLERNPLLFFKVALMLSLGFNILLLWRLFLSGATR